MNVLINFFTLRPAFTFFGLQLVWYLYLLNTVVQAYTSLSNISRLLEQRHVNWDVWSPNLIPFVLGILAQLAIARLVIEVAAIIISNAAGSRGHDN
jgi:uncharacterized membrane protein YfcA